MSRVIKEEILSRLKEGISLVSFLKRNGELRTMQCTLDTTLMPPHEQVVATKSFLNSSTNGVVAIPVWDIEHDGWRSFRIDSIISFEDKDK
jgi:hypothetical protein|tara:strand:- start:92 stop:364 length:273 start_codon:yes stop_codon:yes gene_type:complete